MYNLLRYAGIPNRTQTNRPAVIIIIVDNTDRLAIVYEPRKPKPNFWKFPGGSAKRSERVVEAAIREAREETGLLIEPNRIRQIAVIPSKNRSGDFNIHLFAAWVPTLSKLSPQAETGEITRSASLQEIRQLRRDGEFMGRHIHYLDLFLKYLARK